MNTQRFVLGVAKEFFSVLQSKRNVQGDTEVEHDRSLFIRGDDLIISVVLVSCSPFLLQGNQCLALAPVDAIFIPATIRTT